MKLLRRSSSQLRLLSAFAAALLAASSGADAQTDQGNGLPPSTGILDVLLESPFAPSTAFVLLETGPGDVRQYRAAYVSPQPDEIAQTPFSHWAFGAPIRIPGNISASSELNFTFFWANEASNFKTSAVQTRRYADVKLASVSDTSLEKDLIELESEIKNKRIDLVKVRDEFDASLSGNPSAGLVEEIVRLRREQLLLERSLAEKNEQLKRLEVLVNQGREVGEPENIDAITKELSVHLREAAQVTSMADRLNNRRKDAATAAFGRKLEAVKQMEAEDPEALAREVIALRKRRQELETRMGMTSARDAGEQF